MSSLLNTAITGIRLNQTALAVTGHNIVNANTEGYSRQSVVQSTNPALRTAAGYLGAGVRVDTIVRNSEKYLVDQVLRDIGSLSEADAYLVNVSQVNNLLAADKTNLANYMNQYFDAMNQAINDPGSLLGRELLLTQSQELAAGFRAMNARLQSQNDAINKQLQGAADNISSIARQIAEINTSIADAQGTGGAPNDLLDKLDMLVTELGRYVSTTTVPRDQGGLDVFIGQGQPLVVGNTVQTLQAVPGRIDASRYELVFVSKTGVQDVTRLMTGGEVGGLLRFRQDALTPAIASLGMLATVLAGSINEQNRQGMDLEGSLGGDVFRGINDPSVAAARVKSNAGNMLPNDRVLNVTIDNFADLKASDYELRFPGPGRQYVLTRLSDNTAVASGLLPQELPQGISVDGFSINLEAGSFQQGDRFLIQPVSTAINQFDVKITRAEELAFASPLNVSSSPANQGGASVQGVQVLDVNANIFNQQAQLDPPLLVRFTSSTTFDVLDNSNPARPVPLQPPLSNLSFVPGASNALLPSDPGGRTVVSAGPAAGALSLSADNGYPGEVISIQRTDPVTGFISETNVTLAAGESAADAARRLNNVDGVRATAFTETSLSGFADGGGNAILDLTLNGISLTDPDWIRPGSDAPETVPQPLTADYLRDRINSEPALRDQGIEAISDGVNVRVVSRQGVDLGFVVGGTGSLDMTANGATQSVATAAPGDPVTEVTVGGKLQVLLAADTELTTSSTLGLFGDNPQHLANFLGFQMQLTSGTGAAGQPVAGDSFAITYNRDGSADNRNGLELLALNGSRLLGGGNQTYQDLYGQLTETVGILTSQARVTQSAGESMLRQSMDALQSLSGVNLEEEAARLIQLEQHYNASARLITLARDLFDTLLRM